MNEHSWREEADTMWAFFRENRELLENNRIQLELLREQSQETDQKFQETERLLREQSQETDRKFQETERLMREQSQETDRKIQETTKQIQQTDQRINDVYGQSTNRWGRLMEALIAPDSVRLFQKRNIGIVGSSTRQKRKVEGETIEIDILLTNSTELVVIEVKTQVSEDDVQELLSDLARFEKFFPEYRSYKRYGAIAGVEIPDQVSRFAYKQGVFVLGMAGRGIVEIKNDLKFKPKIFGPAE